MKEIKKTNEFQPSNKRMLFILLSFLLPALIILIALAGLKVVPFGDNSLAISDGNSLYINYLGYVARTVKGQENILFSFEKGLGGNMMGSWGWFLLNPFFVLFSFADITNYMQTYTYVSILNFSICGLTMYILLREIYGNGISNLIFSTAYALNGFLVANVFQMNFFTGVAALPIMVLGLRRILMNRNPLIYILALAYSLMTNFYFGFMLCVASLLIFIIIYLSNRNEIYNKKSVVVKYMFSSLLAGMLSCIVWLPALLSLRGGRLDQTIVYALSFKENMPFLDIFTKLFTGANSTSQLRNGLPNIYVGILPIALLILFFMNDRIGRKHKTAVFLLLAIYLISFYIIIFNFVMHGGTTTNWFNYRNSFVFSFVLLMIAAEEWQYICDEPLSNLKKAGLCLLLVTIVVFSKQYEYVIGGEVLLDFTLLLLMFLALWMHKRKPENNPRRTMEVVILLLVCLNLYLNYEICTKSIMSWTHTVSEYQDTVIPVSALTDAVKTSDPAFYRMEIEEQRSGNCGNDPMLYGYYGVGHGGSDDRNFVRNALEKLGVHRFDMRNSYGVGINPATDNLLGLKYLIAKNDLTEEKDYEKLVSLEEWGLYKNQNALPIAFLSDSIIEDVELEYTDVFDNLNRTWAVLSGKDVPILIEEDNITFTSHNITEPLSLSRREAADIVAEREDALQDKDSEDVSDHSKQEDTFLENTNEGSLKEPPENSSYIEYSWIAGRTGPVYSYNRAGIIDDHGAAVPVLYYEGYYQKGDTITGYLPVTDSLITRYVLEDVAGHFCAAYADNDALHELATIVKSRPCTIEKVKDTHLYGEFTAEAGQELMFTIPYDEGWTCYVDGEKVPINMVLGVFMSVDVPEGTHSYEMKFFPTGMKTGIGLSVAALLTTIVYIPVDTKRRKHQMPIQAEVQVDKPISAV